jgi:hypothetical protein
MCFSPEVSFASAAVLIPTGMWATWTAARKAPRLWPLAVVPAVFGVQQACEGLVWLGQRYGDDDLKLPAGRAYLFFALAFWPFWFSASAAIIEPERSRRRLLVVAAALSTGWFWFAYLPVLNDPAVATSCVCHNSIRYAHSDSLAAGPLGRWGMRLAYILTATVPLLSGSLRGALILPLALAIAAAGVAAVVYDHAFTSVWCLFAAVVSASLVYTISTAPRLTHRTSGEQ